MNKLRAGDVFYDPGLTRFGVVLVVGPSGCIVRWLWTSADRSPQSTTDTYGWKTMDDLPRNYNIVANTA